MIGVASVTVTVSATPPTASERVDPGRDVDLKDDVLVHVRAEPAQFDFDGVVAGRQAGKIVGAGLVGDRRAGGARRTGSSR